MAIRPISAAPQTVRRVVNPHAPETVGEIGVYDFCPVMPDTRAHYLERALLYRRLAHQAGEDGNTTASLLYVAEQFEEVTDNLYPPETSPSGQAGCDT